jgi:hypothetical protein
MAFFPRLFRLTPRSKRTYSFVAEGDSGGGSFSSATAPTGQTWVDGSPILRKVISFPNGPNVVQLSIGHGIVPAPTRVIGLWGCMQNAGGDRFPLPWVGETLGGGSNVSMKADDTNVYLTPTDSGGEDFSLFNGFIVIEWI